MIDIIVPIYNAYDDLVKCVESVKKWTDLSQNVLILIDDCSSDERIRLYLDSQKGKNIRIIYNSQNQGFSGNINLGMQQTVDHDVILLNSDTIVTKGWLEKIAKCAYSDDAIATVTPLSNNATLCSVPNFCEENKIPEGYTIDSYGEFIEKISLEKYPRIPVAHGFCMYIKREVIKKIGMFDAQTFGRGYGEENDFCHRAEQVGYYHVMCDNTFVYHSGTSSFLSEEKRRYIEEHDKILLERYPEQVYRVSEYCKLNPNKIVFENIKIFGELRANNKKNILYLLQSDFREGANDNIGGTQLHVKDLTMKLRRNYNIFVAARDCNYLNVTAYIDDKEFFFKFHIGEVPPFDVFYNRKIGDLYGKILDVFQIGLVHIHHTYGLTLDLYKQAFDRKIPIYVTLHDYYVICPMIKMLDNNDDLCVGKDSEGHCQECLNKQKGIARTVAYIKIWREKYEEVLKLAEKIIVPSEIAKKIILSYYNFLEGKICVVEHGSDSLRRVCRNRDFKQKFHVAFLGGISPAKGSKYAYQMIKNSDKNIEWYLFGMFGHNDLSMLNRKNFHKIGGYTREELPDLLEKYQIDLICILPIWPETFCYTVSEAVMCGIPILATNIGAVGDRVRELGCGWLVPHGVSYQTILEKIDYIINDKEGYQKVCERIEKISLTTIEEMAENYIKLYEEITFKEHEGNHIETITILKGYLWANSLEIGGDQEIDLVERLAEAEKRLQVITGSVTYKTVQALAKVKIPYRRQIKSLLFKIYKYVQK